ncbi:ribosomal RNA small subunit methyltransferase B-like [Condylostylus longicornis]|uniref:ribosomal RNA small subunit methyltransferase B-like n=1 Tax=Condylostylus longicornis TaxID=2530218 RepID=UPI00244E02DC|nr:ribosomal RNA small subunit methyltransferase B-like [Condylostylus longicornis]
MNAVRVRHLENCLSLFDKVSTIANPLDRFLQMLYRQLLLKGVAIEKCASSPIGLQLTVQQQLRNIPEYNEGLIEIQDESSQLVAMKIKCQPGERVLDYCCGRGGELVLHDINLDVVASAKIRLKNAGIRNAKFTSDETSLNRLKEKCDWVRFVEKRHILAVLGDMRFEETGQHTAGNCLEVTSVS